MTNYNKSPKVHVKTDDVIIDEIDKIVEKLKFIDSSLLIIECYPGTDINDLEERFLKRLEGYELIYIDKYSIGNDQIQEMIKSNITDDRVFGFMSDYNIEQFYESDKIECIKDKIKNKKVIVYGVGAILLYTKQATLVYANLARWEIQLRLRNGMSNWGVDNKHEEMIKKFKRGYFFEWRLADKIKRDFYKYFDYILDLNNLNSPKLISASDYRYGLSCVVKTPFRLVPFFDPGVWGGQWMKEHCNLDKKVSNYAWSFDGVPEENSLYLEYGNKFIEIPAIDVVFFESKKLLGNMVYKRFGTEFPIRFDFLDTIDGGNLSLQVHPLKQYIKDKFGMNYTQDESYYVLDTKSGVDTFVYLGLKTGVDKENFAKDLNAAQEGDISFDVEKYINKIPCKAHDHFLIPAGTIHCSGKDTMVLEISATPYIFTFKLWDWDRVGLDGLPRPIHLNHGLAVIDFKRDTEFVNNQLVNRFEKISSIEEKTGLHELEFIETRRFFSTTPILHLTYDRFNMLNLVAGQEAIVKSPTGKFKDYKIHYAETFIIPAFIDSYTIESADGEEIGYIKAYMRGDNE